MNQDEIIGQLVAILLAIRDGTPDLRLRQVINDELERLFPDSLDKWDAVILAIDNAQGTA